MTSVFGSSRSPFLAGELRAPEIDRFFDEVCGAFPDSSFLHYNLPRARRVLGAGDYQRLIERVPNLVATKTTSGGVSVATDLVRHAGELEHYLGEGNFAHGAMNGGCSLLAGYAWLDADRTKRYFEAGLAQDAGVLAELQMYYFRLGVDLFGWDAGPRIDGAYDKVVVRLGGFRRDAARAPPALPRLHRVGVRSHPGHLRGTLSLSGGDERRQLGGSSRSTITERNLIGTTSSWSGPWGAAPSNRSESPGPRSYVWRP